MKKVSAQLKDPKRPKERKKKLLLGLHEQCWHATADRLHSMLEKAGMPKEVLQLIREVIPHDCARCKQFAHAKHRPRVKTLMDKHFNHIVQCDLFFLWDLIFVLLIDETTKYTFVGHVNSKSFEDLRDCLLQ